ncbi:RasGEF domain containing protein [Acanthamoeba castellanii str. Neff]|uniref:RasGEF domain containing protein n=1 Tax=Acanthamoeba castellanii (strain ATCC 30010 / Neff) TaxID=1257118 RepID=L8GZN8_ACACF|nr:RasGEF domain containing protein [Acanthamoeba castellanii str. Neff]ELR17988.1 RasGEF domain containing protein [Acanthamoeba castellanii str. Neff]
MDSRGGDSSGSVPVLPLGRRRTKEEAFHILAKMVMQQTNEDYVRSFLLTYKKFSTSSVDACDKQEADQAPRRSPLPTRLLEFLRVWVEEFTDDFAAQPQTASLLETIKERCSAQVQYKYKLLFLKTISSHQQQQLPPLSPHHHNSLSDSPSPSPRSPQAIITSSPSRSREATPNGTPRERANSRDSSGSRSESETGDGSEDEDELADDNLTIDDFTAQQIAAELTRKEQQLFVAIPPSEFLEKLGFGQAPPADAGVQSSADEDKTPLISAFVEHFNNVSFWVSTDVLMGGTPKEQAKKITKFIAVAVHLFNLNNFNGLMEIIAGLNFSSVKRLTPAWAKVSSKDRKVFEKLASRMAIHSNYKAYRQLFQKRAAPKLPYFAVILRDLMFVQVGNLDYLEASGLINFEKILLVYEVLSDVKRWQRECKDFKIKLPDKHGRKVRRYMRRLTSIQDESILFFLSSLHEGENKKCEGEVGGMGALGAAPQRPLPATPQGQGQAQLQTPRMSDASDPGEETGEEESSLSDISIVVTSLEDDDDDDDADDDDYRDVGECSPSPSSTTSSTSSSFSSLSVIAAAEEIDFEAEAQTASGSSSELNEHNRLTPRPSEATEKPLQAQQANAPSSSSAIKAERRRSRSVDNNETRLRQQLQLPQRRGATNTEIYGSLRYSRKHAGAVQGPMDGSTIGGAVPLPLAGPSADDSNFMRAIARRRELKKNPFGSILALQDLVAQGSGGEGGHENQTLQLRMKRLCFAEEQSASEGCGGAGAGGAGGGGGPRSIAERIPPLSLHRSADERLLQKRRLAISPREQKRTTIEEAGPLLAATTYDDNHRKRGSSWTGKSKDDADSKKTKDKEEAKENEKEKKRMGSLRILSPRRGSNSRAVSTTSPKKGGTMPASPRGDRSLAGLSFVSPRATKDKSNGGSQPTTPLMGRAAAESNPSAAAAPSPTTTDRNSDEWGELEDGGDEEWEFGQWLEKEQEEQAWTDGDGAEADSRPRQRRATASVVVKSYWSRDGRVSGADEREDDNDVQSETTTAAQRCRKLTMPPCRICFTKLDPDVRVHMAPFMQLLNHKHGATHKEHSCTFFVYQNELGERVTVRDEQAFQEFMAKGGKRYSTVSRQGPCSLLTYTLWLQ